jgi:hypothetical protein
LQLAELKIEELVSETVSLKVWSITCVP